MSNFTIKINLMRLKESFVADLKGKAMTKKCLVIPVEGSGVYVGEKGVYLNMSAFEMSEPKYEDSHLVKLSVGKDVYNSMGEEERRALPVLGGMRKINQPTTMEATHTVDLVPSFDDPDDLPF